MADEKAKKSKPAVAAIASVVLAASGAMTAPVSAYAQESGDAPAIGISNGVGNGSGDRKGIENTETDASNATGIAADEQHAAESAGADGKSDIVITGRETGEEAGESDAASLAGARENVVSDVGGAQAKSAGVVATANGVGYGSLSEAVASAPSDATQTNIVLQNDAVLEAGGGIVVPEGSNIVLDMQGHSITGAADFLGYAIENYGKLTIAGNGTIDLSASSDGFGTVRNYGDLVIENGEFRGKLQPDNDSGLYSNISHQSGTCTINGGTFDTNPTSVVVKPDAELTVNGGYFEAPWYPAVDNNGKTTINGGEFVNTSCSSCDSANWGYTLRNGNSDADAEMTINDATVRGTQGGVAAVGGLTTINGGDYDTVDCEDRHGAVFYALYVAGEAYETSCIVHGGDFSSEKREAVWVGNSQGDGGNEEAATLIVDGGTFTGGSNVSGKAIKMDQLLGSVRAYGGTFSSALEPEMCADGYEPADNGDGTYTAICADPVAKIGERMYPSVADAAANARDGETIEVLRDTESAPFSIAADGVTVDLGGNALTLVEDGSGSVGVSVSGEGVVMKNGTLADARAKGTTKTGYCAVRITGEDASLGTVDLTVSQYAPNSLADYNYGIRVDKGASYEMDAGTSLIELSDNGENGAELAGGGVDTWGVSGVCVYGDYGNAAAQSGAHYDVVANFHMSGGASIDVGAFAIAGNGSAHGTMITIDDGASVRSGYAQAIYHPQDGILTVDGGDIEGRCGLEIRAGAAVINGGDFVAGNGPVTFVPNSSGSTSDNCAIAVAQHQTKLPISVSINGGTFNGTAAFAEADVEGNGESAANGVSISIDGGDFAGAVQSGTFAKADGTGFASGGKYDRPDIAAYAEDGLAAIYNRDGDDKWSLFAEPASDAELAESGVASIVTDADGNRLYFLSKEDADAFAQETGLAPENVEDVVWRVSIDLGIESADDITMEVANGSTWSEALAGVDLPDGYELDGWFTDAALENELDMDALVAGDVTVFALLSEAAEEPGEGEEQVPGDEGNGEASDGAGGNGNGDASDGTGDAPSSETAFDADGVEMAQTGDNAATVAATASIIAVAAGAVALASARLRRRR